MLNIISTLFFFVVLFELHFFEVTWLMPLPSSCLNFKDFNPQRHLKVAYFFSRKEEIPLHAKPTTGNFRWKGCYFQYVLLRTELFLHLELTIFDYGKSGISASIHLGFTSYLF